MAEKVLTGSELKPSNYANQKQDICVVFFVYTGKNTVL